MYGGRTKGRNSTQIRSYLEGGENRAVGLETGGVRLCTESAPWEVSRLQTEGMWLIWRSQALGTGFQSFVKHSSVLNVSGELHKAARPDRTLQTQTMGRSAVTGVERWLMTRKSLQKLWNWCSEGVSLRWGHKAARKTYFIFLPAQ